MGVFELLRGLFVGGAAKLVNTNRTYYMRSLYLVNLCRALPEVDGFNPQQLNDVTKIFGHVEKALKKGTLISKEDHSITQIFEEADKRLNDYLVKYGRELRRETNRRLQPPESFEMATQMDIEASELLKKYKQDLGQKLLAVKGPLKAMSVNIWGMIPLRIEPQGGRLNPDSIFIEDIRIEQTASLDILMHRLIEYSVLKNRDDGKRQLWGRISLKLYPQFYTEFPMGVAHFHDGKDYTKRIQSVNPWEKVKEYGILHIIVDRGPPQHANIQHSIQTLNGKHFKLPEKFANAWPVTGNNDLPDGIAVRQRTRSFSLCLWIPGSSSTDTLSSHTGVAMKLSEPGGVIGFPSQQPLGGSGNFSSSDTLVSSSPVAQSQPQAQQTLFSESEQTLVKAKIATPSVATLQPNLSAHAPPSSKDKAEAEYGEASISHVTNVGRPQTPVSESTESPELDENGHPLPGWTAARHRRPGADVDGRLGVATVEKVKKKGFWQKVFGR